MPPGVGWSGVADTSGRRPRRLARRLSPASERRRRLFVWPTRVCARWGRQLEEGRRQPGRPAIRAWKLRHSAQSRRRQVAWTVRQGREVKICASGGCSAICASSVFDLGRDALVSAATMARVMWALAAPSSPGAARGTGEHGRGSQRRPVAGARPAAGPRGLWRSRAKTSKREADEWVANNPTTPGKTTRRYALQPDISTNPVSDKVLRGGRSGAGWPMSGGGAQPGPVGARNVSAKRERVEPVVLVASRAVTTAPILQLVEVTTGLGQNCDRAVRAFDGVSRNAGSSAAPARSPAAFAIDHWRGNLAPTRIGDAVIIAPSDSTHDAVPRSIRRYSGWANSLFGAQSCQRSARPEAQLRTHHHGCRRARPARLRCVNHQFVDTRMVHQ